MNNNLTRKMSAIAIAGIFVMLSACDSGNNTAANTTGTTNTTGTANNSGTADNSGTTNPIDETGTNANSVIVANDFTFPEVSEANGAVNVSKPAGPKPVFSARRVLSNGTGNSIAFGDPVVLKYKMYSWSSGAMVESTDTLDEPITVRAGVTDGIPEYLSKSLLGRNIGDKLQIIFESGMDDLPEYLDQSDAYVIVLDLI